MIKRIDKEELNKIIRRDGFRTYTELIRYWIDQSNKNKI
jgi:hypothetical protein